MKIGKAFSVLGVAVGRLVAAFLVLLGNEVKRPMANEPGLAHPNLTKCDSVVAHSVVLFIIGASCLRPISQLLLCALKAVCFARQDNLDPRITIHRRGYNAECLFKLCNSPRCFLQSNEMLKNSISRCASLGLACTSYMSDARTAR